MFFQGKTYSEAEFEAQKAAGTLTPVEESFPIDYESVPMTLGDIMAFSGPIPEIVNGRLVSVLQLFEFFVVHTHKRNFTLLQAMLAFVAALGAELATGESVLKQFADEPTAIILTFITFAAASLIAIVNGASKNESFGPFKAEAEMLNGRAAMIGFAALLIIEGIKGSALF